MGTANKLYPMKQDVLTLGKVCPLFSKGHSRYRSRRTGERRARLFTKCTVGANLSILNLDIAKKINKRKKDILKLSDSIMSWKLGL